VADAVSQTDVRKEAVYKAFWGGIKQHINQKIVTHKELLLKKPAVSCYRAT
jgi:phosphopantetheinyl transferase (holo-ACP synthase)